MKHFFHTSMFLKFANFLSPGTENDRISTLGAKLTLKCSTGLIQRYHISPHRSTISEEHNSFCRYVLNCLLLDKTVKSFLRNKSTEEQAHCAYNCTIRGEKKRKDCQKQIKLLCFFNHEMSVKSQV
jgi:hypothetical protein